MLSAGRGEERAGEKQNSPLLRAARPVDAGCGQLWEKLFVCFPAVSSVLRRAEPGRTAHAR